MMMDKPPRQGWLLCLPLLFLLLLLLLGLGNTRRECSPSGFLRNNCIEKDADQAHQDTEERLDADEIAVYVFDSGVRTSHKVFASTRFIFAHSPVGEGSLQDTDKGDADKVTGNGHGTFVASILAYAASDIKMVLIPITVVDTDGLGRGESVLKATEFVVEHRKRIGARRAIILSAISLVEPSSSSITRWLLEWISYVVPFSLQESMQLAHKNNIVVVTAAGNYNRDMCGSRNRFVNPSTVIVGAMMHNHPEDNTTSSQPFMRSRFSNVGPCISIFGPAKARGASAASDATIFIMEGTSVAAPIVARALIRHWWMRPWETRATEIVKGFLSEYSQVRESSSLIDLRCDLVEDERDRRSCVERTTSRVLLPRVRE